MQWEGRSKKKISIYFIVPAPAGISPGQRFRFEHYLDFLNEMNIEYKFSSFYSDTGWAALYSKGRIAKKIAAIVKGFLKRLLDLVHIRKYDFVFIFREATPLGPPFFEFVTHKLLRKRIIYDFDDAIWIPYSSQYNNIAGYFKWFGKIASICKWSYKISVGNDYLAEYARTYNPNVIVIPTVVDTVKVHNEMQDQLTDHPNIGWTGTFSTLKYLDIVLPVLQKLEKEFDFTFNVIADRDPVLPLKNYRFIKWNKATEREDILSMHIGLMPLYDDDFSKGKCGFKAIQYMALGIPAVVSPVGVNSKIVNDGINGFVCNNDLQWEEKLKVLIKNSQLRKNFGIEARKKIEDSYSVLATRDAFVKLFM